MEARRGATASSSAKNTLAFLRSVLPALLAVCLAFTGGWVVRDWSSGGSVAGKGSEKNGVMEPLHDSLSPRRRLAAVGDGPRRASLLATGAQGCDGDPSQADVTQLIADIKRNAPAHVRDRCVRMVSGRLDTWGQGTQDWVLFHTFFRGMKYGEGFYVDAGANNPVNDSNTYFYDACLGWKGICIEPNPMYVELFKQHRTCTHVKNCVSSKEQELILSAHRASKGEVRSRGPGIPVLCRPLQDILAEARVGMVHRGQQRIDFVSLDIEGHEFDSLRCFPFDAFDAPIWVVETLHERGRLLDNVFGRAGYWMSPGLMAPRSRPKFRLGISLDNIFVRWKRPKALRAPSDSRYRPVVPALVLGPDYLPGGALEGAAFLPPCREGEVCPATLPSVDSMQEHRDGEFKGGECRPFQEFRHRLSN